MGAPTTSDCPIGWIRGQKIHAREGCTVCAEKVKAYNRVKKRQSDARLKGPSPR